MKLLREPLVHFLLIGAAIYGLYGLSAGPAEEEVGNTITISTGDIQWMQDAWRKRWNRLPTDQELVGLVEQQIRETVLYREAMAMGLDQDDVVIRRRLAQKLEFIAQDLAALIPPTDEDLITYFDEHIQRYQEPTLYTMTQVFIDPDKRGDTTLEDAEKIKAELMAQADATGNPAELGDDFMLQNYYPARSATEIQKLFGSGFTESMVALAPDQWHGPVLSGYGVHLVYIHSIDEPPAPVLEEVRDRVAQDWDSDKRESLNELFYAGLKDRYTIIIEEPDVEVENIMESEVQNEVDGQAAVPVEPAQ